MKIVRKEMGRFESVPESHLYDLISIENHDYLAMISALQAGIETYESKGWTDAKDVLGKSYINMKSLYARLTDYKNHDRTFNGRKVLPYSQVPQKDINY